MNNLPQMFFNIYSCIQCQILIHNWHINISPLRDFPCLWSTTRKHSLPPPNVQLGYDTTVGPHRGVNIDVIRYIVERETTQARMIPHLHRKIEDLNMSFINLFVVQPPIFIQHWILTDTWHIRAFFLSNITKF